MDKFVGFLGLYYGEPALAQWLAELGITEKPKLPRGEDTTHLSNSKLGIEITFRDSEALDSPGRDYPDGALVLTNIRFYGINTDGFFIYTGELPLGVRFGLTKASLLSQFGNPDWTNSKGNQLQWEKDQYWFRCNLNDQNAVEIVSLQRPMNFD